MNKERIHICIEPHLKSQISELAEIVTGSPKNFSQTISSLLNDYIHIAHAEAKRIKAERQSAIQETMRV